MPQSHNLVLRWFRKPVPYGILGSNPSCGVAGFDIMKDEIVEDFENEDFDEDESPSILYSVLFYFSVFLMLILMVSYVWISFPLFDVISGRMASDVIQGNVLRTNDLTVHFQNDTLNEVLGAYYSNQDVETSLCMEGSVSDNNYFVSNVYEPEIFSQSFRHVTHARCSDDTILMFHTHPYQRCEASPQDIRTLESNQEINPEIAMIIMCGSDRFSVYN